MGFFWSLGFLKIVWNWIQHFAQVFPVLISYCAKPDGRHRLTHGYFLSWIMVEFSSPHLCCWLTLPLIPQTLTHYPSECSPIKPKQSEEKLDCSKWMTVFYLARKTLMLGVLEGKDSMPPLSQQSDAYPLLLHRRAASSIRIDYLFLLVFCLPLLQRPSTVSGPADGRWHRWACGCYLTPFVHRSVAPNGNRRAVILQSQGEMKSEIAIAKWGAQGGGIHSALFSILKENQGMEWKRHNGNNRLTLCKSHAIPSLLRLVTLSIPRYRWTKKSSNQSKTIFQWPILTKE